MIPSVPLPTDNLYKFLCLLGLAIVLAGMAAVYAVYNDALEAKIRLLTELATTPSAVDTPASAPSPLVDLKRKLLTTTQRNEQFYAWVIGLSMGVGCLLVAFGATRWYKVVQLRDDKIADLQCRKLELEVQGMEAAIRSRNESSSQPTDG
jgi:hypothetical protein